MIDISCRLSQEKKEFHFKGFYKYIKGRFYKSKVNFRIKPVYSFERKFYRNLLLDVDFAKSILFGKIDDLVRLESNLFYKKHRLYFLLCMEKNIRNTKPFNMHFASELKDLPKDIAQDILDYGLDKVSNDIKIRCKKVFNYDQFIKVNKSIKNDRKIWNAYNYLSEFSPKVCPYCNLDLTTTLEDCLSDNKARYILRPALDHFLPQSLFPFYSLSVNNLVPSCNTCNSQLKKDIDFSKNLHASPMGESFKNRAKFGLILANNDYILNAIDDLYNENKIDVSNFRLVIESSCSKSKRNIETFELLKRYNEHSDMYRYFLENIPKARPEKIDLAMSFFETKCKMEAIQRLLHYEADEKKHCDIPMSIMKKDLISRYVEDKLL